MNYNTILWAGQLFKTNKLLFLLQSISKTFENNMWQEFEVKRNTNL